MQEFSRLLPEDREFEIGGEVYAWVTPYWEDLAKIFDEDQRQTEEMVAAAEAEERGERNGYRAPTMTDNLKRTQERIALFLPADQKTRWSKLCKRKTDPVPMFMFGRVYSYLLEVATGRPTSPPSPSAGGGGNEGASSPAASPSQAGERRR